MLNPIEVRDVNGGKMTTQELFYQLTDEDFIHIAQEGMLESLCNALSVDLHSGVKQITNEC